MKRLMSSLAALVAVACLVSACGQKGPLYLPEEGKDTHESHQHPAAEPAEPVEPAQQEPQPAQ